MSHSTKDDTGQGIGFGVIAGFLLSLLLDHAVWIALGPALGLPIGAIRQLLDERRSVRSDAEAPLPPRADVPQGGRHDS